MTGFDPVDAAHAGEVAARLQAKGYQVSEIGADPRWRHLRMVVTSDVLGAVETLIQSDQIVLASRSFEDIIRRSFCSPEDVATYIHVSIYKASRR